LLEGRSIMLSTKYSAPSFNLLHFIAITVVCLLLLPITSKAETDTLQIPEGRYFIDHNLGLILCPLGIELINGIITSPVSAILLDEVYHFETSFEYFTAGQPYSVFLNGGEFQFYFTSLPVIAINCGYEIPIDFRVTSRVKLVDNLGDELNSWAGIRIRGGTSVYFPKKSYRLEFLEDSIGPSTRDVSLLGLRNDDDWLLLSMFNEPLKLRNMTCHALWQKIHEPYYKSEEPNLVAGTRTKYIEVFLNGNYYGLYLIAERVDRKQLKLRKFELDPENFGELFKAQEWGQGVVSFNWLAPYSNSSRTWDGYEKKYPNVNLITEWNGLYSFKEFVLQSGDQQFRNEIFNHIDKDNAVDYFIFINVLRALDNTGKNTYMGRYKKDQPYFYTPWDLDATLGMYYDGTEDSYFQGILTNGLYNRLLEDCNTGGFISSLQTRWTELRSGILQTDTIMTTFNSHFNTLNDNGNYARENLAWNQYTFNPAHLDYTENWLNNRFYWLDEQINSLCNYPTNTVTANIEITLYPNPVIDYLYITGTELKENEVFYIYNQLGIKVYSGQWQRHTTIIDVSGFNNGLYLLQWAQRPNSIVKFVKN